MTNYMYEYKRSQKRNRSKGGTPQPGEVWWAPNLEPGIDSPVVVMSARGGWVTVRRCLRDPEGQWHRDVIDDYIRVGLDFYKYVEFREQILYRDRLVRKMGRLSDHDRRRLGVGKAAVQERNWFLA